MPESKLYLAKAREALREGRAELGIGLAQAAARASYLAAFHAAQALIFERSGKVARTHRGVHGQFLRLSGGDARLFDLPEFLSRAYNFKAVADYAIDPGASMSLEQARSAIQTASRFVESVAAVIDNGEEK